MSRKLEGGVVGDQSSVPLIQVYAPHLEGMHDCQELLFMNRVSALCRAELA